MEKNVCILMYADDVVIIADDDQKLQEMLNYTGNWCKKWQMEVNHSKSNIVHFRNKRVKRSDRIFSLQNTTIEYSSSYKYLGILFDEHLTFDNTAQALSDSGGRALGAINSKFKYFKNMHFKTYTKLYNSCVKPVTNYGAGIWGYKHLESLHKIQYRAMRFFLGVHKFAPLVGIIGDMGWIPNEIEIKIEMIRIWNRMILMDDDRVNKTIFLYDYNLKSRNWSSNICEVFREINMENCFNNLQVCNLHAAKEKLIELYCTNWENKLSNQAKLRTYKSFKKEFYAEKYVELNLSRCERAKMAQLRLGILPLRIETGRFRRESIEERKCYNCTNEIEDETHFLLYCPKYNSCREHLFENIINSMPVFRDSNDIEKLNILMNDFPRQTAKFINGAYNIRTNLLYK